MPQHLSETRLTTDGARDREPAWSPDGSKIAFTKSVQGNNDIYVMSADGFSVKELAARDKSETGAVWSPDGTRVAYSLNEGGSVWEIYIQELAGGLPLQLTHFGGLSTVVGWSAGTGATAVEALSWGRIKAARR